MDGKTQNQSETLNGIILNRLQKNVFIGADVLQLDMYDAVAHFSTGSLASVNILNKMTMVLGKYFEERMKKADKEQIAEANHKNKAETKKRRKVIHG